MANTFPTLSSGSMKVYGTLANNALAKYPVSFGNSTMVRKLVFVNDEEQRWVGRPFLFSCVLSYRGLNGYDLSLLQQFFLQMRGAYVDPALLYTFTITLAGNTYDWCVMDQDEFSPQIEPGEKYSLELRIRQLRIN